MSEPRHKSMPEDLDTLLGGFHSLMPHRVQNVLLVSSLYGSFIIEEEGLLTELITSEYMMMNLSHTPAVTRVSTAQAALELLGQKDFDLVITMTRLADSNPVEFARAIKEIRPGIPVVVLADEPRELMRHKGVRESPYIERAFLWTGDASILVSILKYAEDLLNVEHDVALNKVRVILLVENSVRAYSRYLPLIYQEVVKLTQSLMAEGLNPRHRLLRMRARPKILLATSFEEAWETYTRYAESVLGIISDVRFPRGGRIEEEAGLELAQRVRADQPTMPILLQSSEEHYAEAARAMQIGFANKNDPQLNQALRNFMLFNLGFGDFVFYMPDGREVGRAHDLRSFAEMLAEIPDECLAWHAQFNHFSNWLFARTEFELALKIRPQQVSTFGSVEGLRRFMLESLAKFREQSRGGIVADFSRKRFEADSTFTRIGGGSIGGKGRGLAFMNALLRRMVETPKFGDIVIEVPNTAVVGTDVFDEYMSDNGLWGVVSAGRSDARIIERFLEAELPSPTLDDLETFLRHVRYPLAVRSSSLLEDSLEQPLAGIYSTHMVPNNHAELGVRLAQLCQAIKLVYASTFLRSSRAYLAATSNRPEDEKMAVVLQQIVGSARGGRFYPTFSGVVRSHNFYPTNDMAPEDGVANVALGLGKTVVEGGECLMFSPKHPHILPQFPNTQTLLRHSQRAFYALDISRPEVFPSPDASANLLQLDLSEAERDGVLALVGSVYSAENDRVYDGLGRAGTRLVTFAPILKQDLFPLAEILVWLLEIGGKGMACSVEIEFAVDLSEARREFGFLQIRPSVAREALGGRPIDEVDPTDAVCFSTRAMGNGTVQDLRDVLYVKPGAFDSAHTREMAAEIGRWNELLRQEGRGCVLIGPGRWGSSDRWLGIPIHWDQISTAQVIVETQLEDFVVTPSQGTHLFQNLTALGISYLTINPGLDGGHIDWAWLDAQPAARESQWLRLVRLERPVEVVVEGRTQRGVVLKPRNGAGGDGAQR